LLVFHSIPFNLSEERFQSKQSRDQWVPRNRLPPPAELSVFPQAEIAAGARGWLPFSLTFWVWTKGTWVLLARRPDTSCSDPYGVREQTPRSARRFPPFPFPSAQEPMHDGGLTALPVREWLSASSPLIGPVLER